MRASPAAIVACVLLGMAVSLSACGDRGTATAGSATTASGRGSSGGPAVHGACRSQLRDLLVSLDALRSAVAVGMTYDDYLAEVRAVKDTYEALPVERLELPCLLAVASPAEQALNLYLGAANAWGACLAVASCRLESVEPGLQRRWRIGSKLLSSAQAGLGAVSQPRAM